MYFAYYIMNLNFDDYIKQLIADGYIDETGEQL